VDAAIVATERKNLSAFGYGVKSFGLSMIEAAITVTGGAVPTSVLADIVDMVRTQMLEPVRLLDHVPEVLAAVGADHRLILITKGDLVHQNHKVTTSGLAHHFEQVDVVLEKDVDTYARVLAQAGVAPDRFCMVGNSVRSDVLPVLALGAHAIHVPYPYLWELGRVEHAESFAELTSLAELPAAIAAMESSAPPPGRTELD
jgi:putative hydrolase of the HAD superfamily